jgi:beta-glucuronidase
MLYPQLTPTRCVVSLNGMWELAREHEPGNQHEGFKAEKHVAVPASYNDLYAEEGFRMWKDGMWYQREFTVPKTLKDERLVLRFGAVAYRARVFVNGREVGGHEGGHLPFECEVTDVVEWNKPNLLCVRCENRLSATTVPMGELRNAGENGQFAGQYPDVPFDFFPYAGIQRDVCLYTTPRAAWLESVRVTTAVSADGVATVTVAGRVGGVGENLSVVVGCMSRQTVMCDGGREPVSVSISGNNFTVDIRIPNAELWDVFQPNLYDAVIQLFNGDDVVDTYDQRFGIRTIRVTGNRLLLNGRPVYLQGFGRHEDFPIIGRGLCHAANVRDHELLKWVNANSYRTTHYPYSEELVRLADEQGILLIAEAPAVSVNFDHLQDESVRQELYDRHAQALKELIDRDFNAPSVIAWSVANEATTNRPAARDYFATLAGHVRRLDETRPVTMVTCKVEDDLVMDAFDMVGVNFYPGWYHEPGLGLGEPFANAKASMRHALETLHQKFNKPILVAEFGADCLAGLHSLPAEQWSEEYQADLIMTLIDVIRECDFVIGEHVWNFADFRTAQNFPRAGGNKKGAFTRDRQPKMVAHFLRRRWAVPRYPDEPGSGFISMMQKVFDPAARGNRHLAPQPGDPDFGESGELGALHARWRAELNAQGPPPPPR